jgi:hypothetical protein
MPGIFSPCHGKVQPTRYHAGESFIQVTACKLPLDDFPPAGNLPAPATLSSVIGGFVMPVFLGMILGALFLVVGVYIHDSMATSTVAGGQVAQTNRTIVNWDVAAADWNALKVRAQNDWTKLSSK